MNCSSASLGQGVGETPSQPIARYGGIYLSSQAAKEAESKKIRVPGRPTQEKVVDPHFNENKKLGMVACLVSPTMERSLK
jgi:hypothetical protein